MSFQQSPSTTWEPLPIAEAGGAAVWIWYRPADLPDGLLLNLPAELHHANLPPRCLSLRWLLHSAGIDAAGVSTWLVAGHSYDGMRGTSPLLDQPIPPAGPGGDSTIAVRFEGAAQPMPITPPAGDAAATFDRIDADWHAALQVEKQIAHIRRQLGDMVQRLTSLNRDLSPEERLHADRKDKTDWQNARRWLRDLATKVAKSIKDQDIGDTSAAGKRNWFEELYNSKIVPRQPFDGLEQTQREFESYRKSLQLLMTQMNTAHAAAAQDGERRAKQILQRIAASARSSKLKR